MRIRLLSVCGFLLFNTASFAAINPTSDIHAPNNGSFSTPPNGTLAITIAAAPAGGLSIPKIFILHNFTSVYHNAVNWGDTWTRVLPSGNYKIYPLPVSDGTNLYIANSMFVLVPSGITVNELITYHSV